MARRGRFGRRPRSSPDLTQTIVSMAREYQSTRDRNLLNSWNEGGKFEGKQVTDQMLLDHLQTRRDGLSKDDPLWDEMDQKLTEYTFAVDNSKMELKYAEGKVSDGGMAAFYARAATKLPENSEAWRKMRTLAAQYKDRASSGGGGGGRGGSKSGYNSEANRVPLKKEVAYDVMMEGLTYVALREGILQTTEENLGDLRAFEGDATRLVQLMEVFNTDPKYAKDRERMTNYIKKWGNENFKGAFTWDSLAAEKVNKDQGLSHRITKAQKGGHATDTKALTKELEEGGAIYNTAIAADPLAQYESAHNLFELETEAENATPLDLYLATQKYSATLKGIHDSVGAVAVATNDKRLSDMTGRLNNEIISFEGQGDINAPTLWESSRGVVAGSLGGDSKGDTAKNVESYAGLRDQMRLLVSGAGTLMRVDNTGQPTDNPKGSHYAVVPNEDVEEGASWVPTGGSLPPTINFEGKDYPTAQVMTAVIPTRVYSNAAGPLDITGRATQSTAAPKSNENIANIFEMPDGTRLAQYWDTSGKKRWTNNVEGLFGGATLDTTREGYVINVSVPNLTQGTATKPGKPAKEYDPFAAINNDYKDPAQADKLVNTVGLSSFSMWLNSNRTATSDPGVAYAMDPNVVRAAVTKEVGVQKPAELAAALMEVEEARTDYLQKAPDVARRIRYAAKTGQPTTAADKLAMAGYADIGGLTRDVRDFYDRLRARSNGEMEDPRGQTAERTRGEQAERDKLVRAALMDDPNERMRIAAIENKDSLIPNHIKDLMGANQTKEIAPMATGRDEWRKENAMVQNFKALQQNQMAGWAGALAQSPPMLGMLTPPQGQGITPQTPNQPPPTVKPPPPKTPPKYVPPPYHPGKEEDDRIKPKGSVQGGPASGPNAGKFVPYKDTAAGSLRNYD